MLLNEKLTKTLFVSILNHIMSITKQKLKNRSYHFVIYHVNCSDGIAAKWAVTHCTNDDACCIGIEAGTSNTLDLSQFTDKNVIFVDVSPDEHTFNEIIKIARYVTIIDHHDGSKTLFSNMLDCHDEILEYQQDNFYIYINNKYSACQLAWDIFMSIKRPWFINYIADRDLWKWKMESSKDINMAMYNEKLICDSGFRQMLCYETKQIKELAVKGAIINKPHNDEVERICSTASPRKTLIDDVEYNVWLVTCTNFFKSDVGNKLCNTPLETDLMPDFSIIWQKDPSANNIWISLRGNNKVDLVAISKHFDSKGGGHFNASGFTLYNSDVDNIDSLFYL